MSREPGYYWVRYGTSSWTVGMYDPDFGWLLIGMDYFLPTEHLDEIGNRILGPFKD